MTNKEISITYERLIKLQQQTEIRFPVKVSFSIVRNIKILEPIYQDIILERKKILDTYGELDDAATGRYLLKHGQEEKAQSELDSLGSIDNDIAIYYINIEDLDGISLSLEDMDALYFMIAGQD